MEYMAAQMDRQIEDAISQNERLCIENDALSADAALLAWVLTHPETAAECLQDAAAGDGTARENLERRIVGINRSYSEWAANPKGK